MPKIYGVVTNFSIDRELDRDFSRVLDFKCMSKSQIVVQLIQNWVDRNGCIPGIMEGLAYRKRIGNTNLNLRVPKELKEKFDYLAHRTHTNKSLLLRRLIREWIDENR